MSSYVVLSDGSMLLSFPNARQSVLLPDADEWGVGPQFSNFHDYHQTTEITVEGVPIGQFVEVMGGSPVRLDDIQRGLAQLSAPRFFPDGSLARTGSQITLFDRSPIQTVVENGVVINITMPGHNLYPGYVARVPFERDGRFYIDTVGVGNASGWDLLLGNGGTAEANSLLGPRIFDDGELVGGMVLDNVGLGGFALPAIGVQIPQCFLAGTDITMWDGAKKPIEDITTDDWVLSHDKNGNPAPGRVARIFTNEAKIILDFHGTFVTPGHVYFCAAGSHEGGFVPLIDILRDDGVVQHEGGTLIRAATGCVVGSEDDKEFWACTSYQDKDGIERIRDKKKLRLGTRWMLPNGNHFTMREYMAGAGLELLDDGYVQFKVTGLRVPFIWTFSPNLPNPEDFVLARSQTTLDDIYRADQWDAMPPTMPVPLRRDSGPVMALSEHQLNAMPRNMPKALDNQSASSHLRMNRKQHIAGESNQRSDEEARRKAMH